MLPGVGAIDADLRQIQPMLDQPASHFRRHQEAVADHAQLTHIRAEDVHDVKQVGTAKAFTAAHTHVEGVHLGNLPGNIQPLFTGQVRIGCLITAVVETMDTPQIAKLRGIEGYHDGPVGQAVMIEIHKHFMLCHIGIAPYVLIASFQASSLCRSTSRAKRPFITSNSS